MLLSSNIYCVSYYQLVYQQHLPAVSACWATGSNKAKQHAIMSTCLEYHLVTLVEETLEDNTSVYVYVYVVNVVLVIDINCGIMYKNTLRTTNIVMMTNRISSLVCFMQSIVVYQYTCISKHTK